MSRWSEGPVGLGAVAPKKGGGVGLGDIIGAPLNFVGNLGKDIGNAAVGFVPGMYKLVTDPQDALPAIAQGIVNDWKPLFTGNPGEFAKNFYEHPLGPILDMAALFTGGAAGAGRAARGISAAEYGTRTTETVTRTLKNTAEAKALKDVEKAGPVSLDAVLEATEGMAPITKTYTREVARAGRNLPGEKILVKKGRKPGQFAQEITEPAWYDRLAAYSREGSKTLYAYDTVGASGRINIGSEARLPIPYQTPKSVAGKYRAEQLERLMQNFATRGGTLGALPQMGYEMRHAARLGGSIAALTFQMGQLERWLKEVYDPATGQAKHHGMKAVAGDWWDRAVSHAVGTGRIVEVGGKYNPYSYAPVARKGSITRRTKHKLEDGSEVSRAWGMGGVEAVERDFMQMGRRMTTKKYRQEFTGKELIEQWGADATKIDPAKRYHVLMDKHTSRNLGIDAGKSAGFLAKKFYRGTSLWKTIILGYSPRFFVNNFVGNGLLFSMNYMGSGALFGVREYIRQSKGMKEMKRADADLTKAVENLGKSNWMLTHFSDQLGQSLHHSSLAEKAAVGGRGTLFDNPGFKPQGRLERGASKFFGFVGSKAERSYRMAAIAIEVRADARVAAEMKRLHKKNPSLTRDELLDQAASNVLSKNPDLVRKVKQEVENVMGNYAGLTGPERIARNISPFYAWQRHITRNAFHMALDKPLRTALMAETGSYGAEQVEEQLGGIIPHFAKGIIPIGGESMQDGVMRVPGISTGAANPWAQFGELARLGQTATGTITGSPAPPPGDTLGALLNPFLVAGVEALAGKDIFTGVPQDARTALLSPATGLPQFRLGKAVLSPDQYGAPTLYKKDPQAEFLGFLGLTKKDIYLNRLRQLGLAEREEEGY